MPTESSASTDTAQNSSLHEAIRLGDCSEIIALIESGQSCDELDEQGLTVLSALFNDAVVLGDLVTYEELTIYKDGCVDGYIHVGDGCYQAIVEEEQDLLYIVEMMLENGVDPNLADADGRTPLHWAAFYGFEGIVTALVHAGADPDAKDSDGETARDFAIENKQLNIAKLLLKEERFQAVCRRIDAIDAQGIFHTPLDVSISGFLSMKDLTFFSAVAKPETIQDFLQSKLNPATVRKST